MNLKSIIVATCASLAVISFSADAAFVGRLATTPGGTDYQAYYDTESDLTWYLTGGLGRGHLSILGQTTSWSRVLTIGLSQPETWPAGLTIPA